MHNSTDWKKIYNEHSPKLLGICRRYIQDVYTAEDIIQDCFIKAIQNKHQLRDEKLLFAWLKKIVINHALQYLRKNSKELFITVEPSEIPDTLSEMTDPVSEEKNRIFIYDFTREELLSSIDHLPSHHKSVFNLYCIENYSHSEISKVLGISVNTSKSHLLRAKKFIQNDLLRKVSPATPKNKNKITQLLILLGFGGLLWAQTFRSKFSDFNISPSKSFEFPENNSENHIHFASGFNPAWKKKIIITSTLLLIAVGFIFIAHPVNIPSVNTPASGQNTAKENQVKKDQFQNIETDQNSKDNSAENFNKDISQPDIPETQPVTSEKSTIRKQKTGKLMLKDSADTISKKVIIVKKIIQRDTIFVEK
ncbi:RNA polymerase sigma factor [Chryseobacterium tongliaoense]|uniref:RNA polymerase sigma factor n=1 Tax=Chryseobacterium tongliaoense TaxID=3240933 RepID=UPI00351133CA